MDAGNFTLLAQAAGEDMRGQLKTVPLLQQYMSFAERGLL